MSTTASSSRLAIYGAIGANVAIAVSKFVAAYFTGSSAMLSEGIHSLVDSGNGVLILFGVHQERQGARQAPPFGRSKELYFWALIVAILVFSRAAACRSTKASRTSGSPRWLSDPPGTTGCWVFPGF
ncbi:MAG: cation transporter [Hymenobacter sp.]